MMEILFRGKRLDNGEWIEGGIIPLDVESGYVFIAEPFISASTLPVYEIMKHHTKLVVPETVGLYTGLTDKNGKKIFEGDIVRHYNRSDDPSAFDVGKIWWDQKRLCFKRTSFPESVKVWSNCNYEVIGNIHDNPELLKEEQQ